MSGKGVESSDVLNFFYRGHMGITETITEILMLSFCYSNVFVF